MWRLLRLPRGPIGRGLHRPLSPLQQGTHSLLGFLLFCPPREPAETAIPLPPRTAGCKTLMSSLWAVRYGRPVLALRIGPGPPATLAILCTSEPRNQPWDPGPRMDRHREMCWLLGADF